MFKKGNLMHVNVPVIALFIFLCGNLSSAEEEDSEVIDLQELLKDVSSTLSTVQKDCSEQVRWYKQKAYVQAIDCGDVYRSGKRGNGVYVIQPLGFLDSFEAYCDMSTDGDGWTVFQRRGDYGNPEDYFFKTWEEYKDGFGHLNQEFWLGNDRISAISLQRKYELRVELRTMDRNESYAKYKTFWVENESSLYQLMVKDYTGNSGDALLDHSGMKFSTKDRDHNNCANSYKGAWWYNHCHASNLNGLNLQGPHDAHAKGINWYSLKLHSYSLYSEMKMREINFFLP